MISWFGPLTVSPMSIQTIHYLSKFIYYLGIDQHRFIEMFLDCPASCTIKYQLRLSLLALLTIYVILLGTHSSLWVILVVIVDLCIPFSKPIGK